MHPRALAKQRADAQAELVSVSASIGEALGIPDVAEKVKGPGARDPNVAQLRQAQSLVEFLREVEAAVGSKPGLEELDGVGEELADKLREAGIYTADDLIGANEADLLAIDGLGKATLKRIKEQL